MDNASSATDRVRERLESVSEAGYRLGVSRATTYRLMDEGVLRSAKIGRSRRVYSADVDRFIRDRLEGGGLPPDAGTQDA